MDYPVELGATPAEEACQQAGTPDYDPQLAYIECQVYVDQLRRTLRAEQVPGAADVRFKITSNSHDFGTYYDVAAVASELDATAMDAAWWLEDHAPTKWDKTARDLLKQKTADLLANRKKVNHA